MFDVILRPAARFPGLIVFLSAALWGLYWLPLRLLNEHGFNGLWAVLAINVVPLLFLAPMALGRIPRIRANAGDVAIIGILIGLSLTGYALGLYYSTVMRATLLYYLTPVWSTLLAMLILKEHVNWLRWAAIFCGLGGVAMILSVDAHSAKPLNIGDFTALLSGVLWGLGAVWIKRQRDVPSFDAVASEFFFASVVMMFLILVTGEGPNAPTFNDWINAAPILLVFLSLMIPSLLAILWAAQRVSPGRLGILMLSEVLIAGISSAWLAGEYMTPFEWFGAILIVGAALMDIGSDNRRKIDR